jgi:hypothetical protein
LLLVPRIEALALPIKVERATQKPTPNMLQCYAVHTTMANIHIPHRTSTVASFLTLIENLLDSDASRTKRQVNAFSYVMCSLPYTHPLEWTSAKEQPQIYTLFHYLVTFNSNFYSKMEKNTILLMFQTSQYSFILFLTC